MMSETYNLWDPIKEIEAVEKGVFWRICPFHQERIPGGSPLYASFYVDLNKNEYRCMSCGEHGSTKDLNKKVREIRKEGTDGGI